MTDAVIYKRTIVVILIFAFLARVAAALYLGNHVSGLSGAADEISYSELGHRFAEGYGLTFPDGWYPWIQANAQQSYYSASMSLSLAAVYAIFGYQPLAARLLMAALSTLLVWLLYLLAKRVFDERVGLVAAAIASAYAYLIFYGATLVTETPFMVGLVLSLYLAYRVRESPVWWRWVLLGLGLAVTVLFRMAVIFFVPVLLIWLLVRYREQWRKALIPVFLIIVAVLPFTIHNYQLWGRFLLLEAQFGHVFWNGNHPEHGWDFRGNIVFEIPESVLASQNDAQITSDLLRMGLDNVMREPGRFVMLTLTRLRDFFTFWPSPDSDGIANVLRVVSFGVALPFMLAGLFLTRRRWRDLIVIYAFLLIHTGVYAMSWTMIRYRMPLDAVLIPFAAYALIAAYRYLRQRAARQSNREGDIT